LLLAFTPCVLPMVPILSGLIIGQKGHVTTGRAFSLSLTYVLGMALTYTVTGAAFAAAGHQVQALFQQTWIIVLFAALFIALALSMFGLFTVQMPSAVQTWLNQASNRQRTGSYAGVAVMGALSALIVTTCVAPALVATLIVIGQSGAIARGAAALFAMSLGMGAPLLVVGASAGRLLPRAGAWMDAVKQLFGVMMLAVAAWMLSRIVTGALDAAAVCRASHRRGRRVVGLCAAGACPPCHSRRRRPRRQSACTRRQPGAVGGAHRGTRGGAVRAGTTAGRSTRRRRPAASAGSIAAAGREPAFTSVCSVADLQREVQAAAAAHQAVMLDFYADWCTSCKEMQRFTFTDPGCATRSSRCGCCAPTSPPTARTIRRCCTSSRSTVRRPSPSTMRRAGAPGVPRGGLHEGSESSPRCCTRRWPPASASQLARLHAARCAYWRSGWSRWPVCWPASCRYRAAPRRPRSSPRPAATSARPEPDSAPEERHAVGTRAAAPGRFRTRCRT
jgi:thiol:disulfide interchange protein DsbD